MKNIQIIVSLTLLVLLLGCKNTNSSESSQKTSPNSIKEGTSFVYLNEKTDYKDRINLRGTLYHEPWLKIKTEDGKEGWVFGGAVKFYEPIVDANPSPYDKCEDLRRKGKFDAWKSCINKESAKQLKKDGRFVSSNDKGLTFTLLTGEKMMLENNLSDTSDTYLKRSYSHYLPKLGYFVVRNQIYEGGNFSLINDKSGKETLIKGFPKTSPDYKYILTSNPDGEAGFEFNGIEIYGFPNGKFEKILEKEWDGVEPFAAKWMDEKTIHLSLFPTATTPNEKMKNIKIVMNEKGRWVIEE